MTMTFDQTDFQAKPRRHDTPVAVQILSTLTFGAFAIVSVIMAFVYFWPAGVAIAIILAWRGGFGPHNFSQANADEIVAQLRLLGPEAQDRQLRRSSNASFDAYREDVLDRLEHERESFEGFLGRLREAKDQSEFERFMDQRAKTASDGV